MNSHNAPLGLTIPTRPAKPRTTGITMVIDNGLPIGHFRDVIESYGELVDFVKFGWCTGLIDTKITRAKIECLRECGVEFYFGGTLFERCYMEDRLDEFVKFCRDMGANWVEVSDGTVPLPDDHRLDSIRRMRREGFQVLSEVGYKNAGRTNELSPEDWAGAIARDLKAGAAHVITESRESGTVGLGGASEQMRSEIVNAIESYGITPDQLLFEAPSKDLQIWLIHWFGPNVNMGNIAADDIVALETLRLGLRSDTLMAFLPSHARPGSSVK